MSGRERAAAVVSTALGETGAPWDDVDPRGCVDHDTCAAVWALIDAGILDEPIDWTGPLVG